MTINYDDLFFTNNDHQGIDSKVSQSLTDFFKSAKILIEQPRRTSSSSLFKTEIVADKAEEKYRILHTSYLDSYRSFNLVVENHQTLAGTFRIFDIERPKVTPKPKFTSINIFGDSLSDTGNLSTLTYLASGGRFWFPPSPPLPSPNPPFGGPYYSTDPYYNSVPGPFTPNDPPKVRASNGPIWADIFPKELGLPQIKVNNYAYAGATTGQDNGLQPFLPPPLNTKLPLPGLLVKNISGIGDIGEIADFNSKTNGKADPTGLNILWLGANDGFNLAGFLAQQPPTSLKATFKTIIGAVHTAVENIETAITTLAHDGAKDFLVPNLPDLGATPLLSQTASSALVGTAFSVLFNVALAAEIPRLEHTLNIDIVEPNVYALTQDALKNPQKYGFDNVTDPLIAQDPNFVDKKEAAKFFWYDYQHPTPQVHQVLADFFQDNLLAAGYGKNHGSTEKLYLGSGDPLKQGLQELQQSFGLSNGLEVIPGVSTDPFFSSDRILDPMPLG